MKTESNVYCAVCGESSSTCQCDPMRFKPEKAIVVWDGRFAMIKNEKGEFWLGPKSLHQWQAPREKGADVPGWFSRDLDGAKAQAALLETDQAWSVDAFDLSLQKSIRFHMGNQNDPYNIGNAVVCSLREVLRAHRAQKFS